MSQLLVGVGRRATVGSYVNPGYKGTNGRDTGVGGWSAPLTEMSRTELVGGAQGHAYPWTQLPAGGGRLRLPGDLMGSAFRTDAAKRPRKVNRPIAGFWKMLSVAEQGFRKLHAIHLTAGVYLEVKYADGIAIEDTVPEVGAGSSLQSIVDVKLPDL